MVVGARRGRRDCRVGTGIVNFKSMLGERGILSYSSGTDEVDFQSLIVLYHLRNKETSFQK